MRLSQRQHAQHRFRNAIHSVVILSSMVLILGIATELVLGTNGWIFIGVLLLIILLGQGFSPRFIMSLYNARNLDQHNAPELAFLAHRLSEKAGLLRVPQLYYIPSPMPTAFTLGNRGEYVIALSDGLLQRLNIYEIASVLAHELSHIRHHDIPVLTLADIISRITSIITFVGIFVLLLMSPFLFFTDNGIPWLALLVLALAPNIMPLLQLALSRTREFAADLGAAELLGDPNPMISALQKLDAPRVSFLQRLIFPESQDAIPSVLRSHPPTIQRIERLRELSISNPSIDLDDIHYNPRWDAVSRKPKRHWTGFWH